LGIEEESIKYTAFQSHLGQFEFTRAPDGLKMVPNYVLRLMGLILSEKYGPLMKSAFAYIDEILCYSESVEKILSIYDKFFRDFVTVRLKWMGKNINFYYLKLFFLAM